MHVVHSHKHTNGFTLIEVLISITILLVLAAVSMAGFINYAQVQSYRATVDQVRNGLTVARQQTVASYDDTSYGVYIGTSTIEFFEGTTPVVGNAANEIISFDEHGITATSSFSNGLWYMTFERITGAPTATGTITLISNKTTSTTTLTISASGLVE